MVMNQTQEDLNNDLQFWKRECWEARIRYIQTRIEYCKVSEILNGYRGWSTHPYTEERAHLEECLKTSEQRRKEVEDETKKG